MGAVVDDPAGAQGSALAQILDRLAARPAVLYAACFLMMAMIGVADYWTGDEILLFVFELVPVGILAWGAGLYAGLAGSVIATGIVLVSYIAYGGQMRTIYGWHAAVTLVSTSAFTLTVARVRAGRQRIAALLESERKASREDPLTTLATARAFHERLTLEIDRMRRHGMPVSVLYLDLDDFKLINDERGHLAGDQLLARVGRLLSTTVRKIDLCARLGGDEFAVLMPETGAADAMLVAGRIRDAMIRSFREGGASVGMSAGLGTFESAPIDAQVPLNQVDALMYEAKRGGKNRIVARVFGGATGDDDVKAPVSGH